MSTERKESKRNKPISIFTPSNTNQSKSNNIAQTHHSNKSSLLQLASENEYTSLKTKLIIQANILKEYETWVNILLSIINSKSSNESYTDLGTPIQKGLEHIAKLQADNFKLKGKLIEESAQNKKKEYLLTERRTISQWSKVELNECKTEQIAYEKNQLMTNLQVMANELDEQSEKNKSLNESIDKVENMEYYKSVNEYYKLLNDNLLLKQVIELQNEKNKNLYYSDPLNEGHLKNKNSLNYSTQLSLSSRKLGNYLIEEEENWGNISGLFTCRQPD